MSSLLEMVATLSVQAAESRRGPKPHLWLAGALAIVLAMIAALLLTSGAGEG